MGMMINRRRVCGGEKLPYDAEIEYLESTGTQYIIFGDDYLQTSSHKINAIFSPTVLSGVATSGYQGIMGDNRKPQIAWYVNGWTVGNKGSAIPYAPVIGNIYNIEYSKNLDGSYWVDGVDTGLRRNGNIPKKIFWCISSPGQSDCKLYELKILNTNDEVIYYFIPVRVGQVGYMYDRVSKQLFGNSGTGDFILGPDV